MVKRLWVSFFRHTAVSHPTDSKVEFVGRPQSISCSPVWPGTGQLWPKSCRTEVEWCWAWASVAQAAGSNPNNLKHKAEVSTCLLTSMQKSPQWLSISLLWLASKIFWMSVFHCRVWCKSAPVSLCSGAAERKPCHRSCIFLHLTILLEVFGL